MTNKKSLKYFFISNKSQITIFILLGLVIFIIFGFLIYVTSNLSESALARQREIVRKEFLTTTPIKYYITSCLDESTEKALKLIGEQGGYIYNFQDGLINWDIPYITYNASGTFYNISYLIYRTNTTIDDPSAKILENLPNNPDNFYPCLNPDFYTCSTDPPNYLPRPCCICCPTGCGPPDPSPTRCLRCNTVGLSCHIKYPNLGSNYNLDFGHIGEPKYELKPDLLKSNISVGTLHYNCGEQKSDNWLNNIQCNYSIQRQLEYYISKETQKCVNLSIFYGYNLTEKNITTNITFGVDDILVNIEYPITIRQKNKPTVETILYFSLPPKKVRLLKIYEDTIKQLVKDKEIKYITSNLKEEIENIDPNFIVTKLKHHSNATIIILNDSLSQLGATPFIFQFVIENRGPALNYVSSSYGYANGTSCTVFGVDYDVCVIANETIVLKPKGYDPDDNFLAYEYDGWKKFDFMNSNLYVNGNTSDCNDSRRCATYETNDTNRGPHNVTIKIDDGEYADWQTVKIYVN